jgi:hypothetical protein
MDDLERAASGEHEIAGGREDIGSHEAHRWECKASLDLSASAAFVSSLQLLRIVCIRLLCSSAAFVSSRLLIFSASSAFGSSPHLLRIVGIRLLSSSSPHPLHSSHLLIFSASSGLISSPHLLLPRWRCQVHCRECRSFSQKVGSSGPVSQIEEECCHSLKIGGRRT